jgi:MTH538 TIR-like domain (DUF1863)
LTVSRAFISFQMEDKWAREFLVEHAHNENNDIEFNDWSVHEPFNEKWKTNCRARIARTKGTIVLVGPATWKSEAVLWEIAETCRQRHPMFGIQINSDKTHHIPEGLPQSKVIRWNFYVIVRQLNTWI